MPWKFLLFVSDIFSLTDGRAAVKGTLEGVDRSAEKIRKKPTKTGIVSLETNHFLWYSIVYLYAYILKNT